MRQNKGSEEGLERGCRVTWCGWNPQISVAEAENSDERLRGLAASLAGGRKGGGGGVLGPFIGAERDRNGREFMGIEEGELTEGRNGHRREVRSEVEDDRWVGPAVGERGVGPGYRFGFPARLGRGLLAGLGRMASPGVLFIFLFLLSPFSFSVFLFLLYLLHTLSKPGQNNF
jgi:hypothetical protein